MTARPRNHDARSDTSANDFLTVVVPVFNEEAVLRAFHQRLVSALAAVDTGVEIIYIDDGSADATPEILEGLREADPTVGVARFTRHFGKEQAISAGLRLARGAAVVVIDVDLQDPPELIPAMLQAARAGADVVNMRRRNRSGEPWLKRMTAHAFYRVVNRMSDVPIPDGVGDFRLLTRRAVDALNLLPERARMMKGLFAWIGFRQVVIDYDRAPRAAGKSKWHYWALWNLAVEGITSFSVAPLKVATYVGFFSAGAAFFYALWFFAKALLVGDPIRGFPTLIVTMLILGGLQLMAIGVLGEYVARIFIESKRRPLYLLEHYHAPIAQSVESTPQRETAPWR